VDRSDKPVPEVGVMIMEWRGGKSLYNHKHPDVLDTKIPRQADKNGLYEWPWAPEDSVEYVFSIKGFAEAASLTADDREHVFRIPR
jgi:hypothetical protein